MEAGEVADGSGDEGQGGEAGRQVDEVDDGIVIRAMGLHNCN